MIIAGIILLGFQCLSFIGLCFNGGLAELFTIQSSYDVGYLFGYFSFGIIGAVLLIVGLKKSREKKNRMVPPNHYYDRASGQNSNYPNWSADRSGFPGAPYGQHPNQSPQPYNPYTSFQNQPPQSYANGQNQPYAQQPEFPPYAQNPVTPQTPNTPREDYDANEWYRS